MSAFISFLKSAGTDVGVDLCRRQALVAEQFLHAAEIGPAIEQVGGEGMPQGVWGDMLLEIAGADVQFEHPPDTAGGQPFAELVEEQGGGFLWFAGW